MKRQETGCDVLKFFLLAQERKQWKGLMNKVMNLRVPQRAENFLTPRGYQLLKKGSAHGIMILKCRTSFFFPPTILFPEIG
jgi:hypothetical protein